MANSSQTMYVCQSALSSSDESSISSAPNVNINITLTSPRTTEDNDTEELEAPPLRLLGSFHPTLLRGGGRTPAAASSAARAAESSSSSQPDSKQLPQYQATALSVLMVAWVLALGTLIAWLIVYDRPSFWLGILPHALSTLCSSTVLVCFLALPQLRTLQR